MVDHRHVEAHIAFLKPIISAKEVSFRKTRDIDLDAFKCDIRRLVNRDNMETNNLESLVSLYNEGLQHAIDCHASVITKTISVRRRVP